MMSKVLFCFPPPEDDLVMPRGGNSDLMYGLGIPYLMSYLDREGHTTDALIETYDTWDQWYPKFVKKVREFQPDYIGIQVYSMNRIHSFDIVKQCQKEGIPCFVGDAHITALAEKVCEHYHVTCVIGEGEVTVSEIVSGKPLSEIDGICWWDGEKAVMNPQRQLIDDLDSIPFPRHDLFYRDNTEQTLASIFTSRGCPMNCLSGETIIDTTEGMFKIRDLVGKTPKVLTRDPITNDVVYAQSAGVEKTGENRTLMRVRFKDGSHIDCTPDHRFVRFKNGNQSSNTEEFVVEAKDLMKGDSVRAIHYRKTRQGYINIEWGRHKHGMKHRLVMEGVLNRKLADDEHIHHIDHDKENNVETNLVLTNPHKHLPDLHPEMSERMRVDNPAYNLPKEHFVNLGKMQKGKVRSVESRINYRLSKLGEKNPNYKHGRRTGTKSRLDKEVNHVVSQVFYLYGGFDTYCIEVPDYDWFYANGVLVHNCSFCCLKQMRNRKVRYRSIENVIAEIKWLKETYPQIKRFIVLDDTFTLNSKRVIEFCDALIRENLGLKFILAGTVKGNTPEMFDHMEKAGLEHLYVGLESGSQALLDRAHKNLRLSEVELLYKNAGGHPGLVVSTYLITGLPGETWETLEDTIRFVKKLQRTTYNYVDFSTIIWAYPGTEIYDEMKEAGLITDEYWFEDVPCPNWTVEHSKKELREMQQYLLQRVSFTRIFTPTGFYHQMTNSPMKVIGFAIHHPRFIKYALGESFYQMFPRLYERIRGYKVQKRWDDD